MKNYPGNKNILGLKHKIINLIPDHIHYYELFFGSGAIFHELKDNHWDHLLFYHLNDLNKECFNKIDHASVTSITTVPAVDIINNLKWREANHSHFVFLDPPYLHSTRPNSMNLYGEFEMSDEDHIQLLTSVGDLNCNVMIIHPKCELYDSMLSDWFQVEVKVRYNSKTSVETIYMNYDISQFDLQTTHLLGKDCWDRQRIKNKGKRLIKKLSELGRHERQYLKEQINKKL